MRQMMAKMAEDDRIEQMNADKRRMKLQEHKRAVEKSIAERRNQMAQQRVRLFNACLRDDWFCRLKASKTLLGFKCLLQICREYH